MGTDDAAGEQPDPHEHAALLLLLGSDDLTWLMRVVTARVEDGAELVGPVSLLTAAPGQRAAAAALFGRRPAPRGATVRLEELDALLRTSGAWPGGLADAARALSGGVLVLPETPPAARAAPPTSAASRTSAAPASRLPVPAAPPARAPEHRAPAHRAPEPVPPAPAPDRTWSPLEHLPSAPVDWITWWRQEQATGTPARIVAEVGAGPAAALAAQLADVLALLPATGELRTDLAEAVTGSPTDLDDGPLASLALRALRWRSGLAGEPADAVWASAGVVCDELADTVLTLGLPAAASGPTGAALAAWAAVGQPVVMTFRQLRLDPPVWRPAPPGGQVHVFETTGDLAAVLGSRAVRGAELARALCRGRPASVSAQLVVAALSSAGWQLREHPHVPAALIEADPRAAHEPTLATRRRE